MRRTLAAFVCTIVGFGLICPAAEAQNTTPRTALAIYWGPENFPGNARIDAAIQSALTSRADLPVHYFAEYLESEDFPAETASVALRDYIQRKFEGRRIDVVIAVASAALQFALRYRTELFPGVPIVFASVTLPTAADEHTAGGITGVVDDAPFAATLELALTLHPSTKRVFVVARAPSVVGYDDKVRAALDPFRQRVDITYLNADTAPALLAAVSAIPSDGLILYTRFSSTEATSNLFPDEVARQIATISPVPIYTVDDVYLGTGVVGGMMRSADTTGSRLGEIARQILSGTPAANIPITAVPTFPTFDSRQMKRWGVNESLLPPGSKVLFRMPTAWETYRWYIGGAVAVVAVQLFLIVGLLVQRAKRQRAELLIHAREEALRKSYDRTRHLAGRLINAQENARATIARDLHDDVCQRLTGVCIAIDILKRSPGETRNTALQHALNELGRETRDTLEGIRRMSHDLHPEMLRVLGLAPTLKAYCEEVKERYEVQVTFTRVGDLPPVPTDAAACFFRIAQEALRNGIIHGKANRLGVVLANAEGCVDMTISDDGSGFDMEAVRRQSSGLGLISMEERAHAVGADVHIRTAPGLGTTVHVRCPLPYPVSSNASGIAATGV